MYAVFEDGSRQYRVSEGQIVVVDFRDVEKGTRVELQRVLLYQNGTDTLIGQPLVEGARILAEVVDHPSKKYRIQKFRRRKNYVRLKGHRQWYTKLLVRNILLAGQSVPETPAPATTSEAPATTPTAPEAVAPAPETPAPEQTS